jgi:uncharacterized protein (UPF0261 family)
MAIIAVLGTLDTKGHEHEFLAQRILERGHETLLIDVGTGGAPQVAVDISREEVARAGGLDLAALMERGDRGECVAAMAQAAPKLVAGLAQKGRIQGLVSLGGGGGTSIASAAMRALAVGFPKLMVSTLASGDTAPYVGTSDIVMLPSIVDVAGLNHISRTIFSLAAGAITGMVEVEVPVASERQVVAASMFGNTTECVKAATEILEAAGLEVLVFHSTGSGGRAMENLIESSLVAAVLDITTTEWADELVGGVLSAGAGRLEAAGRAGLPSIVAPGCLDMVNFGPRDSVPARFEGRRFYQHNPEVTLMRTDSDECAQLGRILAEKLNAYRGPLTVLLPRGGLSVIGALGGPFHDPAADAALFEALRADLRAGIEVIDLDCSINAPEFARAAAEALLQNLRRAAASEAT